MRAYCQCAESTSSSAYSLSALFNMISLHQPERAQMCNAAHQPFEATRKLGFIRNWWIVKQYAATGLGKYYGNLCVKQWLVTDNHSKDKITRAMDHWFISACLFISMNCLASSSGLYYITHSQLFSPTVIDFCLKSPMREHIK